MWARQYSTLKLIGHRNKTCVVYVACRDEALTRLIKENEETANPASRRDEALTRLMTGNEETANPTPRRDETVTRLMEEAMCGVCGG